MQEHIPHRNDAEAREKVFELIKDVRVAMMVTHTANGALAARPMSAANLKEFSGDLWFFTDLASPKVAEIEANPQVLLSYSEPGDQNYISVVGKAEINRDRAKIEEYWSEMIRVWFPKGKDDPNLGMIRVTVETAEYWDSPASTVVFLYGYAKARLTGEAPKNIGDAAKVDFKKRA